jgi:flagellar P-ring protein precursor FlgI
VAHFVNQTLGGQYGGSLQNGPGQVLQLEEPIARAIGPGVVRVTIPEPERADPVSFVADVLAVRIENPHTEGRIVLNSRTGTVIVTGEVELSPVIVTHKNLVINVGDPAAAGGAGGGAAAAGTQAGGRFVPLMEKGPQATQQLRDLVDALNQLKVPPADIIDILKDLKASGKLHAVLVTE